MLVVTGVRYFLLHWSVQGLNILKNILKRSAIKRLENGAQRKAIQGQFNRNSHH